MSIISALRLHSLKFPVVHLLHFEMDGSQAPKLGSVLLFLTYQSQDWPPLSVTAIAGASQYNMCEPEKLYEREALLTRKVASRLSKQNGVEESRE